MRAWLIGGIITPVVVGILIWWGTEGLRESWKQEPYSVTGSWRYLMTSDVDHQTHKGALDLTMDREIVSGKLVPFDGTDSAVRGTLVSGSLHLTRETTLNGQQTDQFFELTKENDNRFKGTFINKGFYKDSGTVVIER